MTPVSWWHWVRAGCHWDWGWHLWEDRGGKRPWKGLSNAGFRVLEWVVRETRRWGSSCNQVQGKQTYYLTNSFLPTKKEKKNHQVLWVMFHPWFWCIPYLLFTPFCDDPSYGLEDFSELCTAAVILVPHSQSPVIQVCWCREEQGTKITVLYCFWWKNFCITLELEIVLLN